MTDQVKRAAMAEQYIRVCKAWEIPDPGKLVTEVDGRYVVVFHVGGRFYALDDCCTHDDGPLGEGELDGFAIICPRHGAKFDVRDGRVLCMPATRPVASHPVKIENGEIYVAVQ